ncbi:MAG: hypothetical protein H6736_13235 [Alphaproteobacteria bacterium]|nr:hypothetical protein [Alphaproteobacteria bacterium]
MLLSLLLACGGGGLVGQAESAADAACACADAACAKEAVAAFNKVSFKADAEKKAFSPEQKAAFDSAVDRMSTCRDALMK